MRIYNKKRGWMILAVCMMSAVFSGCAGKNAGNAIDDTVANISETATKAETDIVTVAENQSDKETIDNEQKNESDKDKSDNSQSTTQTSSNEEPATEPFSWAIADGSYDAESMNKMRESYEAAAAKLVELESGGTFENIRKVQAERNEDGKIVTYSADDIEVINDNSTGKLPGCTLKWGDNSYTLEEIEDWSGVLSDDFNRLWFVVGDLDGDAQDELIIISEGGARGSLRFFFIDIVDGEAKCDLYKYPDLLEYNIYDDFLVTYRMEDMTENGVKDGRDCVKNEYYDYMDYFIGDMGWWNEDGKLLENPRIDLLAGCTYVYDFYNDTRDGEGGCIIRIEMDINFESMAGPYFDIYSYYKFSNGKLELIGRR